ncbi:hypothetical protein [Maricaulis sp.]|uniref:hypothetical protein n=1 Tax=Maricaulis sp. TaxID=1486257 RepID=UPI003A9104C0
MIKRVDAYVIYCSEVEATDPEAATELAYMHGDGLSWEREGTEEFDACRIVALDEFGQEVQSSATGRG